MAAQFFPRHPLATPSSGIKFATQPSANQRAVLSAFVKKVGVQVLQGAELTKLSLPVQVFEPRTFLQRLPLELAHAHRLLQLAAAAAPPPPAAAAPAAADYLRRFQLCVAFMISGRNSTADSADKPLNPCLGETFQGEFDDGSRVFAEQVSHHPPASCLLLEDARSHWQVRAFGVFSGALRGAAVRTRFDGLWRVTFADGTWVEWNLPYLFFRGILAGERCACWEGDVDFSSSFGLKCRIQFAAGEGDVKRAMRSVGKMLRFWGAGSSDDQVPPDFFEAEIEDQNGQVLSRLEGSWIDGVVADGEVLWDHTMPPCNFHPLPQHLLLPSDCTLRPDVIALKAGDYVEANRLKDELEGQKRNEKALRDSCAKDRH